MNNTEINNIKIRDLSIVLKKETLPESYWHLIECGKQNCKKLHENGIKNSNDLFMLFQNNTNVEKILNITSIHYEYLRSLYHLLMFHSYRPFPFSKITSVDKKYIEIFIRNKIKNNGDLLKLCMNKNDALKLLNQLKVPEKIFTNMISISDLVRKPGVKEIKAMIFLQLGVKTLKELGEKDPLVFREELRRKIITEKLNRAIPTEKEVISDILWARIYPMVITPF